MKTTDAKNILFFQDSILPSEGGVPRASDIISKELTRRGYRCYFVFYNADNKEYPVETKLKADLNKPYRFFAASILNFIKTNEINIFICHNAYATRFIKVYRAIRQKYPSYPFFGYLHASPSHWRNTYALKTDTLNHKVLKNNLKKLLKRIIYPIYNPHVKSTTAIYNISDKFILLSDSFRKSFNEIYAENDAGHKLITIPNPLTFPGYIQNEEINDKQNLVLIACRLEETQKKIFVALKIWQRLQPNTGDWRLVIIGTGPDENFYKKYVAANKLHNVAFLGRQTNLLDYYKKASIFMMTSIWEGFPLSLLEALQNGVVPVVFDNFSAIHDMISNEENGYIIANNDVERFVEKLSLLMHDKKNRQSMALNAVTLSKRYHVSVVADRWEALFAATN